MNHVKELSKMESLFGGSSKGAQIHFWLRNSPPLSGKVVPRSQLREGSTSSGEGGSGHPSGQPDKLNQPWQSVM